MFKICIPNEKAKLWICIYLQIIFNQTRHQQLHALKAVKREQEKSSKSNVKK